MALLAPKLGKPQANWTRQLRIRPDWGKGHRGNELEKNNNNPEKKNYKSEKRNDLHSLYNKEGY